MKNTIKIIIAILSTSALLGTTNLLNFYNNDPEQMILGKWEAESNQEFIWQFYDDGSLKFTESGQLFDEVEWQIVNECEGETVDNDYDFAMLEIAYNVNDKQCYVIQGLNGVLTLLALPQGRLHIFDRVVD